RGPRNPRATAFPSHYPPSGSSSSTPVTARPGSTVTTFARSHGRAGAFQALLKASASSLVSFSPGAFGRSTRVSLSWKASCPTFSPYSPGGSVSSNVPPAPTRASARWPVRAKATTHNSPSQPGGTVLTRPLTVPGSVQAMSTAFASFSFTSNGPTIVGGRPDTSYARYQSFFWYGTVSSYFPSLTAAVAWVNAHPSVVRPRRTNAFGALVVCPTDRSATRPPV